MCTGNILVVDDDEDILSLLGRFITKLQHKAVCVRSGLEALRYLRQGNVRILLTDIVLPDVSGVGLIQIVKKEFPLVPIIAMSGYAVKVEDLVKETGVRFFLTKPFNIDDLRDIIESVDKNEGYEKNC